LRGYLFGKRYEDSTSQAPPSGSPHFVKPTNPLETYFDGHQNGPGIWKWRHYFDIYHRHLAKFIGREVHVLEVGIFSGGSLGMWRDYFGRGAKIYGADIEEACKSYEDENVRVFVGDQSDRSFWKRFREEVPTLDVVIDDGGHQAQQQIVTLEELLPHLRPGGVYVCEDVNGVFNHFTQYIGGIAHNLNAPGRELLKSEGSDFVARTTPFQESVNSIHLYVNVVVVEKAQPPLSALVSQRHGTRWQPFPLPGL